MEGFQKRGEGTRDGILRVSLELFRDHGFKKVSIGDIARRADLSPVTIYNHFGSKEKLVRETMKYLSVRLIDKYRAIIRGEKPFLDKLETMVFDKSELASTQFQGELTRVFVSDPELRNYYELMLQEEVGQLMSDLYEEGKKEGYNNPELSKEAFLIFVEVLRQGIYHYSELPDRLEKNPKLARELITVFTYGLNG